MYSHDQTSSPYSMPSTTTWAAGNPRFRPKRIQSVYACISSHEQCSCSQQTNASYRTTPSMCRTRSWTMTINTTEKKSRKSVSVTNDQKSRLDRKAQTSRQQDTQTERLTNSRRDRQSDMHILRNRQTYFRPAYEGRCVELKKQTADLIDFPKRDVCYRTVRRDQRCPVPTE